VEKNLDPLDGDTQVIEIRKSYDMICLWDLFWIKHDKTILTYWNVVYGLSIEDVWGCVFLLGS